MIHLGFEGARSMEASADGRPVASAAPDWVHAVIRSNRTKTEGEHGGRAAVSLDEAVAALAGTGGYRSLAEARLPAGMDEPFIPFRLVVMWIISRDPCLALEAWYQSSSLRRAITIDSEGRAALHELIRALQGGKLKALGVDREGRRRAIAPVEWLDLVPGLSGSADVLVAPASPRTALFGQVVLESGAVLRLWKRDGARAKALKATSATERNIVRALCEFMRAQPEEPIPKKVLLQQLEQRELKEVPKRMFGRAFTEAIKQTGATRWSDPGRRPSRVKAPEPAEL